MKIFIRWTLIGILCLGGIALFTILTSDFDSTQWPTVILATIAGAVLIGLTFYLVETKYIPWRSKRIQNKLASIFDAKPIADNLAEFNMHGITFLVLIEFQLSISKYGNAEIVSFHIPRQQADRMLVKPKFKYILDTCNDIPTYRVYQTNGFGLALAKRRFDKKIDMA